MNERYDHRSYEAIEATAVILAYSVCLIVIPFLADSCFSYVRCLCNRW